MGADGPGFDRRTPTVIVSHTTPDDVPAGGVYTFVRSPREAAEVASGLAGGKDVDLFSASIGGQMLRAGLAGAVEIGLRRNPNRARRGGTAAAARERRP